MTGEAPAVTLEVPTPYTCTIAELREVREVFHVDLIPTFEEKGMVSVDVLEPLAFLGYRRQGLARTAARRAAGELGAIQLIPEDVPDLGPLEEDPGPESAEAGEIPNPASSAT
jgi:hypothetical protein